MSLRRPQARGVLPEPRQWNPGRSAFRFPGQVSSASRSFHALIAAVQPDASTSREVGAQMRSSLNVHVPGPLPAHFADHQVDLWNIRLADNPPAADSILTPQELQRARSFVSAAARRRFVAGRIALRRILSQYCGVEPSRIPLAYRRHGKPYLKPPFSELKFNLSHSCDVALLAVCEGANIGVDL